MRAKLLSLSLSLSLLPSIADSFLAQFLFNKRGLMDLFCGAFVPIVIALIFQGEWRELNAGMTRAARKSRDSMHCYFDSGGAVVI